MATMYKQVKMAEADELMAKAAKARKTGLFAWRVNHAAVADSYESAAQLYTGVDEVAPARLAWQHAARERVKANDASRAARCLASLASYLQDRAATAHTACVKQMRDNKRNGSGHNAATATDKDRSLACEASAFYVEAANAYEEAGKLLLGNGNGARAAQYLVLAARAAAALVAHESNNNNNNNNNKDNNNNNKDNNNNNNSNNSCSADQLYRRLAHDAIATTERAWEVGDGGALYALPDLYHELTLYLLRSGDAYAAVQAMKRSLGIMAASTTTTSGAAAAPAAAAPAAAAVEQYMERKNVYAQLHQPNNAAKTGLEVVVVCLGGELRTTAVCVSNNNKSSKTKAVDGGKHMSNMSSSVSNISSSMSDRVAWAHRELDALRNVSGFAGSNEQVAAHALLAAFDERDAQQLAQTLHDCSCLRFVRAEVSRIASRLRIDGTSSSSSVSPHKATTMTTTTLPAPAAAAVRVDDAAAATPPSAAHATATGEKGDDHAAKADNNNKSKSNNVTDSANAVDEGEEMDLR